MAAMAARAENLIYDMSGCSGEILSDIAANYDSRNLRDPYEQKVYEMPLRRGRCVADAGACGVRTSLLSLRGPLCAGEALLKRGKRRGAPEGTRTSSLHPTYFSGFGRASAHLKVVGVPPIRGLMCIA